MQTTSAPNSFLLENDSVPAVPLTEVGLLPPATSVPWEWEWDLF